ncbi:M20 family metallopeptidase [Phaeobacter sp. HF9A]|uniref:M20 family metallopeptidase n=1 Tax=Phaeobacter sp. HF9A TaxID=2721561 RepID=UPI00143201C0|nr:M20 family metallopeptidase [Phaeobacter sp. HF9A]NIZ11915.1 M20 family metallopeptidase [Phaeobacter sp. HF9A]
MTRDAAISRVTEYFETGAFQSELADLVTYRSESQSDAPEARAECLRYLTEAMLPRLTALGFTCEILANPDPRGGPLLIGERREGEDLPTILTYGHGDAVLGQDEMWREGLSPWEIVEEGERLYGRGTADNKGQHLVNIAALEAVLAERGHLGFNTRIVLEMSEEVGSVGLPEVFRAYKDRLSADVLIASDGPRLQPDVPTMFMGSRGGTTFDLVVETHEGAHHSGNWGGLLSDPAMILAHALACITDVRGQIKVPEWRPDSLTDSVRAALKDLPVAGGQGPEVNPDWGEEGLTPAERAFGWNSFTVLAMVSGVPEAPVNAISGWARATCQLRYVVGTDPEAVIPALRRHLDAHGFQKVEIRNLDRGFFAATRLDPNHPWAQFVGNSIRATAGDLHVLPNLAGSLPNDSFTDILELPTIWVPHSYRGCSQHAPNEHVLKPVCRDALRVMAGVFWDIGTLNASDAAAKALLKRAGPV